MITLHPSEDRWHLDAGAGSYEWSYFDGLSDDAEWGFVAIWFRGIPMSPYYTAAIDRARVAGTPLPDPASFAAFNINLYHRGRRIFYALHERPGLDATGAGPDAALGADRVTSIPCADGGIDYLIELDTHLFVRRSALRGTIRIASPAQGPLFDGAPKASTTGGDFWVPASLDGRFQADLELVNTFGRSTPIRFSGRAYHDRNFGARPLHDLRGDWYWGRIHSGERVFVYFAVISPDARDRSGHWALIERGRQVDGSDGLLLSPASSVPHWTTLPRPVSIEGGDMAGGLRLEVRARHSLDAGPFYHRMISDLTVQSDRFGEMRGSGITELLRPSRLGVAGFRPFVKFRVRRDRPPPRSGRR